MARFQREAHALASLNHPDIAQIYGFEESGETPYLVMELIEGETLQGRLARGPLTVPETLRAGKQLADALEAAHEKGIVHRDLKPANVKLTRDDQMKVLDFGLAKAVHEDRNVESSLSPSASFAATQAGIILGTAAFMAPEQAKGMVVDRRADIWAFGAIVYQMLTGKQAFGGETTSETLAAVMLKEPAWGALPPQTPPRLVELLQRCLVKDPKNRLQAIGDARIAIEEVLGGAAVARLPVSRVSWSRALAFGIGGALAGAIAGAAVSLFSREASPTAPVTRWTVDLDDNERVAFGRFAPLGIGRTSIALSPDGRNLVYAAERSDGTRLYLRPLDAFDATPIAGTDGGFQPFFSPDGQSVGFFTGTQLKRAFLGGGSSVTLSEATHVLGASWASDGYIYFSDREANLLRRVPADGGSPEVVATWADIGTQMRSVHVLPGAQALFYDADMPGTINVMRLAEATPHRALVAGTNAKYIPTGHIVFSRGSDVFVAAFDLKRLEVTGPAVPVLENVRTEAENAAQLAVSTNGTLAYVPGGFERRTNFVWVDRNGAQTPIDTSTQLHGPLDLSPDGQRIAVEIPPQAEGQTSDVWIYDLEHNTRNRLAAGAGRPFWSADGKDVYYIAEREGEFSIVRQAADGIGGAEALVSGARFMHGAAAPDGSALILSQISPYGDMNLLSLSLQGGGVLKTFLQTPAWDGFPAFSPDGGWLAYSSDESGRYEVYVVSAEQPADRRQISPDGGEEPRWSQLGDELFYRSGQRWMVVPVTSGSEFTAGRPRILFEGPFHNTPGFSYDVSHDAQRVLVVREAIPSDGRQIRIVENWFEEMRQHIGR